MKWIKNWNTAQNQQYLLELKKNITTSNVIDITCSKKPFFIDVMIDDDTDNQGGIEA